MSEKYNYKKPRSINWVSILLVIGLIGGTYWGLKFGKHHWRAYKVDEVLDQAKVEAGDMVAPTHPAYEGQKERIMGRAYRDIQALGIADHPEQPLEVGISPDGRSVYAKYWVVVKHPFGKSSIMKFHRKRSIPRTRGL